MSGTAPYEVNVTGTDDETFVFSLPFTQDDGSSFPFSDYELEYSLSRDGSPIHRLSQGSGITIAAPDVTFKPGGFLRRGEYQHGCRARHIVSGDVFQIFDGSVTISEGNFR